MLDHLKLDLLFNPRSVAVVGANREPGKVGYNLLESIVKGGFRGKVYPVHPRHENILGLKVYSSLEQIPEPVDVAILALNQYATVEVLRACGRLGVKGVICIAGGFGEMGAPGRELQAQLVSVARESGMAMVGPNTLGLLNPHSGFYSTFYPMTLEPGGVGIMSQSGGLGLSAIYRCRDEGVGISKWVGVGNRGSLEFCDYLEYFYLDPETRAIGVIMEGTEGARAFVELGRDVVRTKPVVVLKVGSSELANYAALTHTGTMAGSNRVYAGAFRQHGIIQASSMGEFIAALKALSIAPLPSGERVGVLSHTAGPSISAADELLRLGCQVPELRPETLNRVKGIIGQEPPVILKNPLDVAGLGFEASAYGEIAAAILDDPSVDSLLAVYCLHPNWRFPSRELLEAGRRAGKPVVACYISTRDGVLEDRRMLQAAGIPVYITPEEAAWGAGALAVYSRIRKGEALR